MTAIILRRVDPLKNMRRFYRLDVQPDLFGQWCLIREWGRIGSAEASQHAASSLA
jgi:predicted DNA-binding WGR domain protein